MYDGLPPPSRSAPTSPTHHHLVASDFALREVEAKFALPHTPPSQFSLPSALFPSSAIHSSSSSSLPASPSRPPPGFAAAPFKYFPLGIHSSSVEALAPEVARKRVHAHEESASLPPTAKRICSGEEEGGGEEGRPAPQQVSLKSLHPMALASLPGTSFPQPPPGVQFFQIPMMNQAASGMLGQPLSTFLSQGFINTGSTAIPNRPPPVPPGDQNERTANSQDEG